MDSVYLNQILANRGIPAHRYAAVKSEIEALEMALIKRGIPERMHDAIIMYVCFGRQPGEFLRSLFCNDLKQTLAYADDENKHMMFTYGMCLYNDMPYDSQGSPLDYESWVKTGGMFGRFAEEPKAEAGGTE